MKKAGLFLSALLAACMLFAFAGCGDMPANGQNSNVGETSAASNETHDEQFSEEWKGYEAAKESGYEGTFTEYLQQIGLTVTDDTACVNEALTTAVCVESIFGSGAGAPGSLGSGVIYSLDTASGDAYIITNYHVVYGKNKIGQYGLASKINVYFYGGYVSSRAVSATFYRGEMEQDIAVLLVKNAASLKQTKGNTVYASAAKLGGEVKHKERVYAIGNPAGGGFSVTAGVVSVVREKIQVDCADGSKKIELEEIRTDAAINHGNSGGGLFNAKGELVGIVNARSEGAGEENVGYALPIENVKNVLLRLGFGGVQ